MPRSTSMNQAEAWWNNALKWWIQIQRFDRVIQTLERKCYEGNFISTTLHTIIHGTKGSVQHTLLEDKIQDHINTRTSTTNTVTHRLAQIFHQHPPTKIETRPAPPIPHQAQHTPRTHHIKSWTGTAQVENHTPHLLDLQSGDVQWLPGHLLLENCVCAVPTHKVHVWVTMAPQTTTVCIFW